MNIEASPTTEDLQRQLRDMTERTLSPVARYGHLLLLLVSTGLGISILSLLLTEPSLPPRTQAAFIAMVAIAGCWVGYSLWTLVQRRPLLQAHRVLAGCLASAFSGLFAGTALTVAIVTGSAAAWLAGALGAAMTAIALLLLVRARRQRRALQDRRADLQRALSGQ